MPLAEAGRSAMGRIDVQPDVVPPADVGHVSQQIKGPDGRRTGAGADGHHRLSAAAAIAEHVVELLRVHPPPLVQAYSHDLTRPQPEDSRGSCH